jgi:hypothetical protein
MEKIIMTIKKFLINTIAAATFVTTSSAIANGMTIHNNSSVARIGVQCTGSMPAIPIVKGQTVNLSWAIIHMIIGNSGNCKFYNGKKLEATASLAIDRSLQKGTITSFVSHDASLKATFNPGVGTTSANIKVDVPGGE